CPAGGLGGLRSRLAWRACFALAAQERNAFGDDDHLGALLIGGLVGPLLDIKAALDQNRIAPVEVLAHDIGQLFPRLAVDEVPLLLLVDELVEGQRELADRLAAWQVPRLWVAGQ